MAYITYNFKRSKNAYEKSLDYNDKLTWIVSFISNWFFITDVTELSSNERTCYKGFNNTLMLLSSLYLILEVLGSYYFMDYSTYLSVFSYFILIFMILIPSMMLMFKTSFYFFIYYIVFFNLFDFDFGVDYIFSGILCLLYFVLLNIPGYFYNKKYFNYIKSQSVYSLESISVNYVSPFWIFNYIINKTTVSNYKKKEIDSLK